MEEYQAPLGEVSDAAPRVGERLRRARMEKGLDLADIARETRVPQRHLVAIENDSHDQLPALTYSIGFVKTFSRAVGLPPEEMATQFKAETTKAPHVPQALSLEPLDEARLPPRGLVAASTASVIAIVGAIWIWGAGLFESTPPPLPAEVAAPVGTSARDPVEAVDEQPLVSGDAPMAMPADSAPVTAPATDGPDRPVAAAQQAQGPVVLTATQEVWIKVYDSAQQTVKMGILQPGESYTVPGDRGDLQLWTGRAGALRVSVGGRAIPPLGGPSESVQGVSLAPGALLARGG